MDATPLKAPCGVYGSWVSLILVLIFFAGQFFVSIAPPETTELNDVEEFFMGYLTLPVIMLFWAVAYMIKRQWFMLAQGSTIGRRSTRREL